MKNLTITLLLLFSITFQAIGQRKILNIPDLPGYVTVKCDFHLHTVFSDGAVWPTMRIDEALRDGLDAIAITDHLEYTPKKDFIPLDFNAAWKISESYARERNIILVHGTEITRSMPPGHFNALFIKDANLMAVDSVWDAFEAAIKQDAFLQWNHPGWRSQEADGIPKLYDFHKRLLDKGWLHGIEFYNDTEYYPLVMTFCKQYNLTVIANSDVHGIVSEEYREPAHTHRPMTLVFAKAKNHDSIKEAMFAGRTLAYFRDMLAGKEEYARHFFYQCISIGKPYLSNSKNTYLEITNKSDIPFYLVDGSAGGPGSLSLPANAITRVVVTKSSPANLTYNVRNVLTGEKEVLKVDITY